MRNGQHFRGDRHFVIYVINNQTVSNWNYPVKAPGSTGMLTLSGMFCRVGFAKYCRKSGTGDLFRSTPGMSLSLVLPD